LYLPDAFDALILPSVQAVVLVALRELVKAALVVVDSASDVFKQVPAVLQKEQEV
jgi:hypothetical protein